MLRLLTVSRNASMRFTSISSPSISIPLSNVARNVSLISQQQQQQSRLFSSSASSAASASKDEEGHPDFETKSKVNVSSDDEVQEFLKQAVKDHPVLLFMKGTPEQPRCGFSKRVVDILVGLDVDFASADVLASSEIREGIKKFSDWPTLPQLYVDGNFVGGCDIITDMHSQGQLKPLVAKYVRKQKSN